MFIHEITTPRAAGLYFRSLWWWGRSNSSLSTSCGNDRVWVILLIRFLLLVLSRGGRQLFDAVARQFPCLLLQSPPLLKALSCTLAPPRCLTARPTLAFSRLAYTACVAQRGWACGPFPPHWCLRSTTLRAGLHGACAITRRIHVTPAGNCRSSDPAAALSFAQRTRNMAKRAGRGWKVARTRQQAPAPLRGAPAAVV